MSKGPEANGISELLTKAMDLYPLSRSSTSPVSTMIRQRGFEDQQIAKEELKTTMLCWLLVSHRLSRWNDLKPMVKGMQSLSFGDHHRFKNKDITRINEAFEQKCKNPV